MQGHVTVFSGNIIPIIQITKKTEHLIADGVHPAGKIIGSYNLIIYAEYNGSFDIILCGDGQHNPFCTGFEMIAIAALW